MSTMSIIKIKHLTAEQRKEMKIPDEPKNIHGWSVWECEPSSFDWRYSDTEEAYVYQGKVKVRTANGEIEINKGDFVMLYARNFTFTFDAGLSGDVCAILT